MEKIEIDSLIKLVDEFVATLKKDLLSVEVPAKGFLPGVWDKMKNWYYNFTKKQGANDPENPYVYKNKFGSLGDVQESARLSLSQYRFIRDQYESLETSLSVLSEESADQVSDNVKKLRLFKIIDSWADRFKQAIKLKFLTSGAAVDAPKPEVIKPDQKQTVSEPDVDTEVGISQVPKEKPATTVAAVTSATKSVSASDKEKESENPGAGRPGKGLVINWSGKRLSVKKQISGVAQIRNVETENLVPISVLKTKNKNEIENLEHAAENNVKLVVYNDLIKQLPGEFRQRAGQETTPVLFDVNEEDYDAEFKKAFKEVLTSVSNEYSGKERTKGSGLHKQLIRRIYRILDSKFPDRAEEYDVNKLNKFIDDALSGIES